MAVKADSARVAARVDGRPIRAAGEKPRTKTVRLSKLEAKHLASFRALMKKYGGKCTFAGSDE